jgi:hypothetical protein
LENSNKLPQDGILLSYKPADVYANNVCVDLWIEFCKSKARADRWAEEVALLREEMKRVKLFFQAHAHRWMVHADAVGKTNPIIDLAMAEGLHAYAKEQSAQFYAMRSCCKHIWRYAEAFVRLGQGKIVPEEAEGGDDDENT